MFKILKPFGLVDFESQSNIFCQDVVNLIYYHITLRINLMVSV